MREATVSFVRMEHLDRHWKDCSWKPQSEFNFNWNLTGITGTANEDLCKFMLISRSVLLRMRNIVGKSVKYLTFRWPYIVINSYTKPTRCTNFSNLFLEYNSTYFGQFLCPSSGVFHCTHSNGIYHTSLLTSCGQEFVLILLASCKHTCMTYTIAVCTVRNSWWWTEELSEICRVVFQK